MDPAGLGPGRLQDRHQCGGAVEAVGANRLRRRIVAGDAGAQGERRGRGVARAGKRARKTPVPRTLVFDEIDIGIGGRAAEAVGQKLKELSRAQQVLCVTHLPQIAAFADQHFLVEKQERQGKTKTSVRLLKEEERTEEVARMLSGAKLTDTSLRHAEQMLKTSRKAASQSPRSRVQTSSDKSRVLTSRSFFDEMSDTSLI